MPFSKKIDTKKEVLSAVWLLDIDAITCFKGFRVRPSPGIGQHGPTDFSDSSY